MKWLVKSATSSLGQKYLVALTGAGLVLFVIAHMLGNLQIFAGRDALNAYAAGLKSMPGLLWGARLGLVAMAGAHIGMALKLAAANKSARPVAYQMNVPLQSTASSRSMAVTGLLILTFALFHLAHFTWGWVLTDAYALTETLPDGTTRHDVFSMVVAGFQQLPLVLLYLASMVLLGLHLNHGIASILQTLGLNHHRWADLFGKAGQGLAWALVVGNISMPLAVMTGFITLPDGVAL